MDNELTDEYLEYNPNCLEYIRKEYNLNDPDVRNEAIQLLQEWVQKQEHFVKKDFDPWYLEKMIILGKGSVETVKKSLDNMCTNKTLLPQFFDKPCTKEDYDYIRGSVYCMLLPKQADYQRVYLLKLKNLNDLTQKKIDIFVKLNICITEYAFFNDYCLGSHLVLDISDQHPVEILTKVGVATIRNLAAVFVEGYHMRIHGVYIISPSKLIDTLVTVIKQVVSPKIANRIWTCNSYEDLYNYLPREILPKEYGGAENSLDELRDKMIDRITGEEHMNRMREMNSACTNETYRQGDKFNEEYAGMPGTFRQLKVD